MHARLSVALAAASFIVGCGQEAGRVTDPAGPLSPTALSGSESAGSVTASNDVGLPFHSELTWQKIPGNDTGLCTRPLPEGKVYLMRNTNVGTAITTHLGTGEYENHTCVYGLPPTATTPPVPQGWFADIRWTAANGDVLLATSDFLYWTGAPGSSVAVDRVRFQNGGTGRFQFAEGDGLCYVDAPARTAVYEGTIRYGKREK